MSNTFDNYPAKYLLYNQQLSKNLTIVMEIEGVPDLFGVASTFTQIKYGDANIVYGLPGLVYGGLRSLPNLKPYIVLDDSFVMQQRIEPEQGIGNVGTLTVTLIDYQGEMSKIVSPGIVIPEIIYNAQIRIWIGYAQTSYPEDFVLLFSGYCTTVTCPPGLVQLELSDATAKVRQPLFSTAQTLLLDDIDDAVTTIPVETTQGFYMGIQDINGNYDPQVFPMIIIDSENMLYSSSAGWDDSNFFVQRGVVGTTPDSHTGSTESNPTTVTNAIYFGSDSLSPEGGIHFIDLCLKFMLSGWNGPCETNILIGSFVFIPGSSSFLQNAFTLASQDAIRDLGLSVGDQFIITGALNSGNDVTGIITGFQDSIITNQVILTDQTFIQENVTTAVTAFRSQYDTLPILAGLQMRMRDVDVSTWQFVKNSYFTAGIYNIAIYYTSAQMGTDTIMTDILLPMGCYGISRFGRASVSVTKPPLPGIGKLVNLDYTNVINPQNIVMQRSSNSRTFYNVVSYEYNLDVPSGNYTAIQYFLDSVSLNLFGGQTSELPIVAPGFRTNLGGTLVANLRGTALLTRYKNCCIELTLKVNWSAGSTIEVSDIVQLTDNGNLQIMNFQTGMRNLGIQLFEVINRQYNVMEGNVDLTLLGGLGFSANSRFGLFSPSSILNSGSTASSLRLTPSFGQPNIAAELLKWVPRYRGQPIVVHSYDYSVSQQVMIQEQDPNDSTAIIVSPALDFIPPAGYLIDIAPYPSDSIKTEQAQYKLLYSHSSPSIPITSGVSDTQFNVSSGDALLLILGMTLIVRNTPSELLSFVVSQEVTITAIAGTLITVSASLLNQENIPTPNSFTPDNTYTVEAGFLDGGGFYRYG